jgi:rhamnogalacturonan acetylesterase
MLFGKVATNDLGGPRDKVYFVQHGSYAAQAQKRLGPEVVNANYPMDNTHTAPLLADVVSSTSTLYLCQSLNSNVLIAGIA